MSDIDTQAPQAQDPVATDTSATVDQSEASTQTEVTPEATQTVEEKQTEEVNAEDTVEEKLYAGKYKSVEDMEKAYQELNSKFTSASQEKAELSRILNEAFATPEQPALPEQQTDYYQEEPAPLNNEIENIKRVQAVQSFIINHNDANAEAMQKILTQDPLVQQISGHEAKLEYAYLKSQNMSSTKAIAEAEKKAVKETKAKIVEKQTTQVEQTKATEQVDEDADLKARLVSDDFYERDKARQEYIRKYLV